MEMSTPLIGSVATGYGAATPPEIGHIESDKGLKDASRDFTSILFSYMFSSMRGNPDDRDNEEGGGSLFGGENVDMFMGFLDQEIGKKFAEQGGKDMVDALYHQLKGDKVYADEKNKKASNASIEPINKNS
ncbi:hypothetical protein EON78_02165 [bacterium]|nr:MAG: hypothetical protein EON78_02165 [bacterium]